jgi:hypothetical protein
VERDGAFVLDVEGAVEKTRLRSTRCSPTGGRAVGAPMVMDWKLFAMAKAFA